MTMLIGNYDEELINQSRSTSEISFETSFQHYAKSNFDIITLIEFCFAGLVVTLLFRIVFFLFLT